MFSAVSTCDYKYFIAVAEVHVAGPYSWVASGGVYCSVCVFLFAAVFVFLLVSRLGIQVQSRVRVNSVKLFQFISTVYWPLCLFWRVSLLDFWMLLTDFEVFIGVHGLALIWVRFLFLFLCPPPCPGGCLCIGEAEADPNQRQPVDSNKNLEICE